MIAAMNFFDFPLEIRLQIYSELLVDSESIVFNAQYGPSRPPLVRSKSDGLYPILLRVNKKAYREASPLLYSNNRFQFPGDFDIFPGDFDIEVDQIVPFGPFLRQIGSQASLIRHICIPFSTYDHLPYDLVAGCHEACTKNLELVRDTCTNLGTLELSILPDDASDMLCDLHIAAESLDLIDTRFKTIPSLKERIVHFQIYSKENLSDDSRKKMLDCGWTVVVTKVPNKVWIDYDSGLEFDNEEDYNAHMDERDHIDFQRDSEQEEEENFWGEEYYRQIDDPYQ